MTIRYSLKVTVVALSCALSRGATSCSADETTQTQPVDSVDRDYSADLKRIPPVPAERALETFEVEPGFKLQLAAAEPLVTDPVAMEFDEHGRLYVVEMLGYSENQAEMLGRIRLLEDADRDGVFESSTVFADGLGWPTAIICYDGGVFVGAAPEILYFKDTDGDRRADERRVAFTGFGTDNVQGLLNSFRWGLDNRIHVAVSRNGAELRRADQPNAEPLMLRGRNFAFDPKTLEVEATSGASQHGFCFDPWGNAFTCHNSDHIQQVMYDDRDMSRNPYVQPPAALKSIAVEGPAADVYRISPIEPWREIRTRLRVKGIVPGVVEGGGRAGGYFTSATGVTIYDGDAWPQEFYGNAFIGDVGSNLVHRKLMERPADSLSYVARRATPGREFVASRDTWFRPVQFANGPDGNLYIIDMYREVIEHPASLPPVLKKHLDLTSGRDRGRIYRVVRADSSNNLLREQLSRELPGDATTEELIVMLGHENGWHRTTASRMLFERDAPAVWKKLEDIAIWDHRPTSRNLASYLLYARGRFPPLPALQLPDPETRRHMARLVGRLLSQSSASDEDHAQSTALLTKALVDSLKHGNRIHRYEVALALGNSTDPTRLEGLAAILRRHPDDEYIAAAVHSSLAHDAEKFVHMLLKNAGYVENSSGRRHLAELCRQIGARCDSKELASLARSITELQKTDAALADELLVAAIRGARSKHRQVREQFAIATGGSTDKVLAGLTEQALETATDDSATLADRVAAIAALPLGELAAVEPALVDLLAPRHPQNVQRAALAAFGQFDNARIAPAILAAWPGMSPTLRAEATELLLSRSASAAAMLDAVEQGNVSPRDLDPSTVQRLKTHADTAIRDRAVKLLDAVAPKRTEVVDAHLDVLELSSDVARGREVFRKNCAVCHRKEGHGTEVGADLATVVSRTPEQLLISILDPNREVDPKYLQYTVLTIDGLAKSGMIAGETATSITLKREEGVTETVPRDEIDSIQSTGMTLMPEGLEKAIDKQSLADLIAYLHGE